MSSRVKKVNLIKNVPDSSVRKQLPSIEETRPGKGASEDDSEEEFYDLERSESDSIQDTLSTDGVPSLDLGHSETFPPWKEELELLVQGGVPMALRGEVCISRISLDYIPLAHLIYSLNFMLQLWQAFVGVRARRVEKYYYELLAPETNVDSKNTELESVGIPEKYKAQIEKVIHSFL